MNPAARLAERVALVAVCLCVVVPAVVAQECPELIGHPLVGNEITGLAFEGDYAYLGSSGEFIVIDVSDPSAPIVTGWVDLANDIRAVAISGDHAYGVLSDSVQVIDVSVPSAPYRVGSIDLNVSDAFDIAASDGYVYLVVGDGERPATLRVIDVTTPSEPVEAGLLVLSDSPSIFEPKSMDVSGSSLYVVGHRAPSTSLLLKIDVSSPSQPNRVADRVIQGATDVGVSDGYAYVAIPDGLRIIDADTFDEVGSLGTPGEPRSVAVSGDYAFLVTPDGLSVIDVSTPSSPVERGLLELVANTVEASEGIACLSCSGSCPEEKVLQVVDVSLPSEPIKAGAIKSIEAGSFVASDGYAYAASSGGLRVFDVSDPAVPSEVGNLDIGGSWEVWGLAVSGDHIYASAWFQFVVIDVSTPSAPLVVGECDHDCDLTTDVTVSGGYAYLGCLSIDDGFGLLVLDVGTPSAPVQVGQLELGRDGWPLDVAVSDGYAFVALEGLRVIDVSMPASPLEVGVLEGHFTGVEVSGDYAYVTGADGLDVVDVSNPATPVTVGSVAFDPEEYVWQRVVAVSSGYAYVEGARYDAVDDRTVTGLWVFDVSTPTAPLEVGAFEGPSGRGFAVSGGAVFLNTQSGLYIFNECSRSPSPNAQACLVPAAAVAAGAEGAFFRTDLELNNAGAEEAQVVLQWLPRGVDNSEPMESEPFTLAPGASLRFENVLTEVFGLEPDSLGALKLVASTDDVIGMSRTYNSPGGKTAGTFGQGLPAIRETDMIVGIAPRRILFLSENEDFRANVGCANGTDEDLAISVGIFDDEGSLLETRTMELGPFANDQINQVFGDWAPINGYVDVWADRDDALYTCYGSMLDNQTSDPTTILPQVPSSDTIHVPAAALAAGAEGSFFTTDLDLNNTGSTDLTYELLWLPRGDDNSDPTRSDTFSLAAGSGVRYADVLGEVFGLEPDEVGALSVQASGPDLLAMSRTYNTPSAGGAGTFGQGLAGIAADRMISTGVSKRILFLSEDDVIRSNVGCINGVGTEVTVAIDLYDSDGGELETKYMILPPYSNRQFNGIFGDHAPINGYVDVRTYTPDALIYCYGSVLDNETSDPTTVLPQ